MKVNDTIYREDAIKAINTRSNWYQITCNGKQIAVMLMAKDVNEILEKVPSAELAKQCNKCKYYYGTHDCPGHAPCMFWNIGGVMYNDYCSRFEEGEHCEQ